VGALFQQPASEHTSTQNRPFVRVQHLQVLRIGYVKAGTQVQKFVFARPPAVPGCNRYEPVASELELEPVRHPGRVHLKDGRCGN
jgi:hypothetical protein